MYFLQATQAPVLVTLPDKRVISVPKMTIREIQEWANEICEQRHEDQTEGLDDDRKREYTRFYPKLPPTIPELKGLIRTVPGIESVIQKTFANATVKGNKSLAFNSAEEIAALLSGSTHQFEELVQELADLEDQSKKRKKKGQTSTDEAGNNEEGYTDPTK